MATEKNAEELQSLPRSRKNRFRVRKYLIPRLDSPGWKEKYNPDSNSVKQAEKVLAEELLDLAGPAVYSALVLLIALGAVDIITYLHSQVYGLFVDAWAAMFLIVPSLKGRHVIATAVEGKPKKAITRLEAQEMVSTSVGFAIFAGGIVLQIGAI